MNHTGDVYDQNAAYMTIACREYGFGKKYGIGLVVLYEGGRGKFNGSLILISSTLSAKLPLEVAQIQESTQTMAGK